MPGPTISHYRVLDKLGAGGMGEVWRAHDTQLDRDVALKLLPADHFADEAARARLVREARMVSRLNHPNICTVHEVGESDGQTYIAMELVEGRTLSARLSEGALASDDVVRIGLQIAEAVAHAHEKRVVHRDLKSANVIVTSEGRVKVLDFGLARRVLSEAADDASTQTMSALTAPGVIAGTPAYMPPEQWRGQAADARSDVWSLGVVLYEMAAGRRPFEGASDFELSSAIVHEAPPPLPAAVPGELGAVISRCLEKDPAKRYSSGGDLRAALEAIGSGKLAPWSSWRSEPSRRAWPRLHTHRNTRVAAAGILISILVLAIGLMIGGGTDWIAGRSSPTIESIAILPLRNLSGDPEQQYFSDGMTEALYTELAKISALKVIGPRSTQQYEGTTTTVRQIARELEVDAIVQGSALRVGDQVRITAQLIDASDENLWADRYERSFANVLVLQSELARAIAQQVQAQLTPAEALRLASAQPVNPEAYDACLRGLFHLRKWTSGGFETALKYYESALRIDPDYARAHAGIALVWLGRQRQGFAPLHEASPKARAAVMKALELDNAIPDVHLVLADLRCYSEWDWKEAETSYRRAIELNASYADARASYAMFLMYMGRTNDALDQMERAMELDPVGGRWAGYGRILFFARRYDESIAQYQTILRTDPNDVRALFMVWHAFYEKGMHEESLAALTKLMNVFGLPGVAEALARGYAEAGYPGAWRLAVEECVNNPRPPTQPWNIANLYLWAGDNDQALEWLERGFDERDPGMLNIGASPVFDPLRGDPRFQTLLRKMHFPG